ncbi:M4 family metallopeptidase [Myxococcus stipitatus]|uniref:M4 family metallopeptidase n=1 Tax=Myxococcus stipitatus TaxID=83455 RepID=UPI0031456DBE
MTKVRGRGVLGAVVLCLTMGACTESAAPKDGKEPAPDQAQAGMAGTHQVVATDRDLVPTFVKGALGPAPTGRDALRGFQPASLAPTLEKVATLFRVSPEQLFLKKAYVGFDGDTHFRFGVRIHDVEVMGAELRLHARNGQVFAANGDARGDLLAPEGATLSADLAESTALSDRGTPPGATVSGRPTLVYWREGGQLLLAYRLRLVGETEEGAPVDDTVLINARTGDLFERFTNIHSALSRRIHDGENTNDLPGVLARTDAPVADPIVNAAYDNVGAVYDCYNELFGRDSFDNAGGALVATVHHRVSYVNAFWNGEQMVFGDGDGVTASNLAESLDVTAHELTHAVTDYESQLIYSGESGGLNESMSDIFGAVCEWHSQGRVINEGTFLVGEDVWTPGVADDALRYMMNPTLDGDSLDDYPDYSSGVDVHYSSGISNLAFYLLAQGGTHPRFPTRTAVAGIGLEKAARIFYKANADLLTPTSTFEAAKVATEQAAQQLGYDAATIESVSNAWKAVQVGIVILPPHRVLEKGVPLPFTGSRGSKEFAMGEVPEGATDLRFTMSGGSGDADMYVRYGQVPTNAVYDCRPYRSGNNEECLFPTPAAGKWYAMVNAFTDYADASVVMSYRGGFFRLEPGVRVDGLSGATNDSHGFFVEIPETLHPGKHTVTVRVQGGTGNVDLYVRKGAIPTHSEYDCRSMKGGTNERCELKGVTPGKVYVWLYGAKGGYSDVALIVTYR